MRFLDKLKGLIRKPDLIENPPEKVGISHSPDFFEPVTLEEKYESSKNIGDFINVIDKN